MTALEGKALLDHGKTIARRYAKRVGPELAEELRAEAMLRALGSPPPDGRMEPWLERIYRNLLIDRWRRRPLTTVELDDTAPSSHGTPEEDVLRHERRRAVRGRLNELPRDARRALLSRFYGELDDHVAASRLGIAPVTMRTRVHRALARLRVRLADLRAFCPPIVGKLGAQVAAVGLAPVLVAALIVAARSEAEPSPTTPVATAVVALPQHPRVPAAAPLPTEPEPTAVPRSPQRIARPSVPPTQAVAASPQKTRVLDLAGDEVIVGEILHPDAVDVFAEPERVVAPCLVEAPPSFLAQIDKMVEERL